MAWPIDKVYRFRTEQIQSFDSVLRRRGNGRATYCALDVAHSKEDNFLVANREQGPATDSTNNVPSKRTPPVSLLTVSIPVQFQINDLMAWEYNNEDAPSLLQDVGTREVVRFPPVRTSAILLSLRRLEASETLRERIQTAATRGNSGRLSFP